MKAKQQKSTPKEQPAEGTHLARLVGITDLGLQEGFNYQGTDIPDSYKLELTYELVDLLMEDTGKPFWISEEVKNSDNEKSTLSARSIVFGSLSDLPTWLTKPCMVTVKHSDKGWAKVAGQSGVSGVPSSIPVTELVNDPILFDLDNPDLELFNKFPEFKQNKIKDNLEFNGSKLQQLLDEVS